MIFFDQNSADLMYICKTYMTDEAAVDADSLWLNIWEKMHAQYDFWKERHNNEIHKNYVAQKKMIHLHSISIIDVYILLVSTIRG